MLGETQKVGRRGKAKRWWALRTHSGLFDGTGDTGQSSKSQTPEDHDAEEAGPGDISKNEDNGSHKAGPITSVKHPGAFLRARAVVSISVVILGCEAGSHEAAKRATGPVHRNGVDDVINSKVLEQRSTSEVNRCRQETDDECAVRFARGARGSDCDKTSQNAVGCMAKREHHSTCVWVSWGDKRAEEESRNGASAGSNRGAHHSLGGNQSVVHKVECGHT